MRFKNCGRLFSINIFPLSFFTSSILFFLFPYTHTRSTITSLEATSSVITTHRPWSSVVDHPSHPLSYSLSLSFSSPLYFSHPIFFPSPPLPHHAQPTPTLQSNTTYVATAPKCHNHLHMPPLLCPSFFLW